MTFVVDYSLDGNEVLVEEFPSAIEAEKRARYISKKHHTGGYDGPLVYVFHKFAASGQRTFFAGRTDSVDEGYLSDRSSI
jgi:hypothetical protein